MGNGFGKTPESIPVIGSGPAAAKILVNHIDTLFRPAQRVSAFTQSVQLRRRLQLDVPVRALLPGRLEPCRSKNPLATSAFVSTTASRSVLTSVHAFATDPTRGIFILALLVIVIGGSLLLYVWRAPRIGLGGGFEPLSPGRSEQLIGGAFRNRLVPPQRGREDASQNADRERPSDRHDEP